MEHRVFEVASRDAGRTVARVLHDLGGFSHSAARGLILTGRVSRNGRPVSELDERVAPGDRIDLAYEPDRRYRAPRPRREPEGWRMLYEDRSLVVVDKPAGLLTVPTPSGAARSLQDLLADSYRARGHRKPNVLPVHRIDRYTSGLVAFALALPAWRRLRTQFAAGLPERIYLAVAQGRIAGERGTLVHHLEEHPKSLKVRPVLREREGARRAACTYRVRERFSRATLLEVRLQTGRRNQIRVQLAAEGHPLLGDHAYGEPSPLIARTALHAARLAFEHPESGVRLAFDSEPPQDFRDLIAALRREQD